MEETWLGRLADYGALGVIAAIAIWGVVRGIGTLWAVLLRREEQLDAAHASFAERLERANAEVTRLVRESVEESRRLRETLVEFSAEAARLHERFGDLLDDLEGRLARDRPPTP